MDEKRLSLYKNYPVEAEKYEIVPPCAFPWRREEKEDAVRYFKDADGWFRAKDAPQNGKALISCTGDLMSEPLLDNSARYGDSYFFKPSFRFVRDILKNSDLAVGNLETTVTDTTPYAGEYHHIAGKYHCNAPDEYLDALRYAGFDVLVNANNHDADSGVYGLCDTVRKIRSRGFMQTGTFLSKDEERAVLVSVNGIKTAILSYACRYNKLDVNFTQEGRETLLNTYSEEKAKRDIAWAKARGAEFILCYIHWGNEHIFYPVEEQKKWAKELADAGCDYIAGSHSHCLQTHGTVISKDGRKVNVIYSLGNFISSAHYELNKVCGIMQLGLTKKDGKITVEEFFIPCRIVDIGGQYCTVPTDAALNGGMHSEELTRAEEFARGILRDVRMRKTASVKTPLLSVISTGEKGDADSTADILENGIFARENGDEAYDLSYRFAFNPKADAAGDTVTGFCTKVCDVKRGSAYFDLRSDMEGIYEAMSRGAGVIASPIVSTTLPISRVREPEEAYINTVSSVRRRFKAKTVFISGMSGKTLAKNAAYAALSEKYRVFTHKDGKNIAEDSWISLHEFDDIDLEEYRSFSSEDAGRCARAVAPDVWAVLDSMGKSECELEEYLSAVRLGAKKLFFNGDDPFLSKFASKYGADTFSAKDISFSTPLSDMSKSFAAAKKIAEYFGTDAEKTLACFDKFDYTKKVVDIDGIKLVLSAAVKCADDAKGALSYSCYDSVTVFGAPDFDSDFENYLDLIEKCRGDVILYGEKMGARKERFPASELAENNIALEGLILKKLRNSGVLILIGGRCADFSRTVRRIFGLCDGNIAEEFKNY